MTKAGFPIGKGRLSQKKSII